MCLFSFKRFQKLCLERRLVFLLDSELPIHALIFRSCVPPPVIGPPARLAKRGTFPHYYPFPRILIPNKKVSSPAAVVCLRNTKIFFPRHCSCGDGVGFPYVGGKRKGGGGGSEIKSWTYGRIGRRRMRGRNLLLC